MIVMRHMPVEVNGRVIMVDPPGFAVLSNPKAYKKWLEELEAYDRKRSDVVSTTIYPTKN